jgi:hypothetical protein
MYDRVMVFKAISVISLWSVLLEEETGVTKPAANHSQTLSHNDVLSAHRHG